MKLKDIPKFTGDGKYSVDTPLNFLKEKIDKWVSKLNLQLNPDFQRGYVWTEAQQIAYMEFILKGGKTPPIQLNHPGWLNDFNGDFVCVDGLQRLTALLKFLDNKLPVFGGVYMNDFEDEQGMFGRYDINIRVNNLQTRKEVLNWYLEMNSGGTVHTEDDLNKVKRLLNEIINDSLRNDR